MPKPEKRPNSWYVFTAGWMAHNAYLHGDRSRQNMDQAYELFKESNSHLLGD